MRSLNLNYFVIKDHDSEAIQQLVRCRDIMQYHVNVVNVLLKKMVPLVYTKHAHAQYYCCQYLGVRGVFWISLVVLCN